MLVAVILARLAPSLAKSHGLLHVDTFRVSAAVLQTRSTTTKIKVWAEHGRYLRMFVEVALGQSIHCNLPERYDALPGISMRSGHFQPTEDPCKSLQGSAS